MSILQIIALILEVLLGVFSAYAAYTLFAWAPPSITQARDLLRYPRWYWVLAGCMASIGAIGLFVGLLVPVVAVLGAAWMVAYFMTTCGADTHVLQTWEEAPPSFPFVR